MSILEQTATALISGSVIGVLVSYYKTNRFKKKELVAKALETALARVEILYKILRRTNNEALLPEDELAIRNEMHVIQQETDYYAALINAESAWLGTSYEKLIAGIKKTTEPLIQEAWKAKPKGVGAQLKGYNHPKIKPLRNEFTKDIRRYFNPLKRLYFGAIFRLEALTKRGKDNGQE